MTLAALFSAQLRWLFRRPMLYLRWFVILSLPFLFFSTLYTVSGEGVRRALDEPMPRYRIAFTASPAAESLKSALSQNKNYEVMPDVGANWRERIGPDSLYYVIETEGDSSGLTSAFIWFDGEKTTGAARLKEAIYIHLQRQNGQKVLRVDSEDYRPVSEKLNMIIEILLSAITGLIGFFWLLFLLWSGRHIAIHAFTIGPRQGGWADKIAAGASPQNLHLSGFLAVWLSTLIAAALMVGGIFGAGAQSYGDDAAMVLRILQKFVSTGFLLQILLHSIPLSFLLAALWSKLNSSAQGSAYRAMRRGNGAYVFFFVGAGLAILLATLHNSMLLYFPFFNAWALIDTLLNNRPSLVPSLVFWGINLAPALWLFWSSRRDCLNMPHR